MKKQLDYPMMVDDAMRGVVRQALREISDRGLNDNHHFYVSFNTRYPGVSISPQLLDRYPQEITIVIQHQFWDLEVYKHNFCVTLSFNNIPEKLVVPFDALTAFADPSVRFGLQFNQKLSTQLADAQPNAEDISLSDGTTDDDNSGNKVISLEAFRKK
jgi:uncharacterized protein